MDVNHVPGKDLVIADRLSCIKGYLSRIACSEEITMIAFATESESDGSKNDQDDLSNTIKDEQWEEWLQDPIYGLIVERKLFGTTETQGAMTEVAAKITKKQANQYVLVEHETI